MYINLSKYAQNTFCMHKVNILEQALSLMKYYYGRYQCFSNHFDEIDDFPDEKHLEIPVVIAAESRESADRIISSRDFPKAPEWTKTASWPILREITLNEYDRFSKIQGTIIMGLEKNRLDSKDKNAIWRAVFSHYKEVRLFTKYDLLRTGVLSRKPTEISCREQGGYGDCEYFHDDETHSYFYNFRFANLETLVQFKDPSRLAEFLVPFSENPKDPDEKVASIALKLYHEGKKMTHLVISDEEYTHRGRNFIKADVYELGDE